MKILGGTLGGTLGGRMRRGWWRAAAALVALALVGGACGGGDDTTDDGGDGDAATTAPGSDTTADSGTPQRGGKVVYAVEAETAGGLCLQEAQLAASGIQIARALYDTLAVPNENGEYVPWLADSWEHNATYDEWTVKLRAT